MNSFQTSQNTSDVSLEFCMHGANFLLHFSNHGIHIKKFQTVSVTLHTDTTKTSSQIQFTATAKASQLVPDCAMSIVRAI